MRTPPGKPDQTTPAMQTEPEPSTSAQTDSNNSFGLADKSASLPVVGQGVSVGAIEALGDFFQAMPANSNIAFVIVIHLSPDQDSSLPQLLQHATPMPVVQMTQTIKIEPNCVYVIPPNAHLLMSNDQISTSYPSNNSTAGVLLAMDEEARSTAEELETGKKSCNRSMKRASPSIPNSKAMSKI